MIQNSPRKVPSKLQETKQQFQELLHCQICYCKATQPTLCPHCSKLFCQVCISTSLKLKSECPNCRKPIKGQLLHCTRFINQITSIVSHILETSEETQKCSQHAISLNYFCENCRKSACCECKMFGEHQNHNFSPISQVYEAKYQKIRDLLTELKGRAVKKQEILTQLENHLILVKTGTQSNLAEIEDYSQKYRNKILNQNTSEQYEDTELLLKQSETLSQIKSTLLERMEQAKRTNCYKFDQEIFDKLESILLKNRQRYENSEILPVIEQAIPSFQKCKLSIYNYSQRQKSSDPIYSQQISYEGSQWRMVVYPKGSTNSQYVSVFLELLTNPDHINLYVYQIELHHPLNSTLNVIKEHYSKFNVKECWGYGKFTKIDDLSPFIDQDGTLTFIVGIRLSSYCDLYQRRQNILEDLQRKMLLLQSRKIEQTGGSHSSINFE